MKHRNIQETYIHVRNINIRYLSIGGKGSPVILLHGLGASAEIWEKNFEVLSRTHRIFAPDLPGFGHSEYPNTDLLSEFYLFLEEFRKALCLDKFAIIGQSLGGGIALQYAIHFPDRVSRLVLVGSAGLGIDVIWTLKAMSLPLLGELFSFPSRRNVEIFFKLAVKDRNLVTRSLIDLYYSYFSKPGFQRYLLKVIRSLVNIRGARCEVVNPIIRNVHLLTMPVLIAWGVDDRVLPISQGRFCHDQISGSVFHEFIDCGHLPFFEKPEAFNRIALDFLMD
jgi:4,5:9,10-diseco-3-hydroxy-5,9,17-trioxoandrosta-1(10),2-diene-4-oate hydrolase